MTRLPVGVVRARLRLFHYKTPTIGSTIPREFLRERLFFLVEVRRKPKFFLRLPSSEEEKKTEGEEKGVTVRPQN